MSYTPNQATQIAFIDANVPDRENLVNNISPDVQIVVLDPNSDGVEQITQTLVGGNYSAVHIISHGNSGNLQLGTAQLNSDTLNSLYGSSIQSWRNSLTPNADILLYGCNFATDLTPSQKLAELTGADIAASNDLTGSAALGGDWELEVNTGLIEAPLAFQVGVMEAYNAVLGTTINVTNTSELIQAINNANSESGAYVGADTINLAAGTYTLTTGTYNYTDATNFNWGNSGLPVIKSQIIINGNNATIQGNSGGVKDFRLFTVGIVEGSSGNLTLNDLTLTGGNVTQASGGSAVDAGGLLNVQGTVTINNSTLTNNAAQDDGGAILNYRGTMTIQNSTISNNTASGAADPNGGGIENDAQNDVNDSTFLNLINSTVSGNSAGGNGGGIRNRNKANITIVNSTIAFNTSSATGGGIVNSANATVQNSIVIGNTATSDADVSGTFTSNSANIIGNVGSSSGFSSDKTGVAAATVLETTLANNGGSTLTHALIANSPAIDAGNNNSVPATTTTDQRGTGYARIFDTSVDIGAFEYSLPIVSLTVTDADADETASNTGTYRISRGTASTGDLTVNLDIDPSSTVTSNTGGTFPVDYSFSVTNGGNISGTGTTRTLTIPNKQTFVDLILNPNDDNYGEIAETLKLNLATGSYQIDTTNNNGIVTIAANDTPTISIDSVTKNEGTGGTNNFTFTLSLSNPTEIAASAKYSTIDSKAIAGSDYTNTTGTITFVAGGATTQTIDIPITTDNINEADEAFQVQLSNPVNATISTTAGTGTGTITNDDTPTVSITPVSVAEGTGAGTTTANFTVSLSNPTDTSVTVNYSTADGTANSTTDYTAATGTLTFNNLSGTSQNIAVDITRDDIYEPDETFTVNLTNTGASNATASATGTITNDDSLPQISIGDVSITEGNSGTTKATFTVSLSNASSQSITVNYATSDGTATTGDSDYKAISSTLITFNPGETTKTIDVTVNGDTKFEPTETFNVNLSSATNATIADSQGIGTITNDDTQPTIAINDVSVTEGNSGTNTATFTVSLSNASSQAVTVNYATSNGTATTADSDYATITSTPITFNPGETSKTITVAVNGDTKFETNETFNVDLTGATNATIVDNQGVGTITNDDTQPTIAINDVSVTEGNSSTNTATFTVSLSNASSQAVTVNYATSDGTATTADSDYTAISSTLITFNPGETTKTIDITINGDTKFENDETFNVDLSSATNATIADNQGVGTITNDDTQPTISINDVTVTEGNSGTTTATFTVSLSNASSQAVTVNYATSDGTATTADSDYTAISSTPITFAAGETQKTIDITVNGDTKFETNETFNVDLTGATNASIVDNQGVGTITNDDTQPTISINDVTVTEGNSGTTTATFTVSLSNASSQAISVNYATSDGTATTGDNDYAAISSTLITFAAGETQKTIDVTVNGDTKFETDETFNVNLASPTNATIADSQGVGTITNDDAKPTVSITPTNISNAEGNSGTTAYTYNVTLSNASDQTVTVNYTTNDGTATVADNDYADNDGTLTFNPGELTKTITVNANGDNKFEADETFTVKLDSATNADLGATTQATGTITNDDTQPTVSISPVTITNNEGNSGTIAYTYTVNLSNLTNQTVTVNYSTNDGTATVGDSDYVDNDGTLTFNPGELTKTIAVNVNGDNKFEADEDFTVRLNSASNAILDATPQATGTIKNDDSQPTISISDVTRSEGKSGTTNFDFTVSLSNPSSQNITVNYSTADGTATAGSDYNAISTNTLTFNSGETSKTISVTVNGDGLSESDENFFVNLSNPTNATIADNQGVGNITNDDNAPTVSNIDKSGNEDSNITFTAADFSNKFSDVDGDSLSKIKVTSLPSNGTLNLSGSNITVNQEIVATDLGNLRFTPDANWNGSTSFGWNGFDGANYANAGATVNLTVNPVNDPPYVTVPISNQNATVDNLYNYSFPADTFQDIDVGDNLTYTATLGNGDPLPSWLFFNPFTRTLVGVPTANDVGSFTVIVKATDNAGASVANPFTLTVANTDPDCFCEQIPPTSPDSLPGVSVDQNTTNNTQFGGDGNDTISGTAVNDGLYGNGGNDFLGGNEGNDNLFGGEGDDTAFGGSDRDWISGNTGNDILNGNAGNDVLNGNEGNDTIRGGQDNDLARGGKDDDLIWGDVGDDTLSGDKGNDTVFGGTDNSSSSLDGRDLVFGGDGDDLLNGNAGNDTLFGNLGNDTVRGGLDDDIACGDAGDDMLFGDRGNDSLCGDDGNDTLYGGNGSPTSVGANGEQDYLCGGIGSDWLFGNEGQDWLNGEEGNDTLIGGKDNDTIYGGADNDWLAGDLGTDLLTGGSGSDLFAMRYSWENDVITDFQDGQDLIGLGSGLTFQQLAIAQSSNNTIISVKSTGELLATLNNIQANSIGQQDFIAI